jgi:endonuclease III related protein
MVRIVRPTLAPATPASETHPPRSPVPSLLAVYEALRSKQGPQHWWPGSSRLEIIVGAILTQNTAWRNVEQALHGLSQQRLLSIPALRTVPLRELEPCVRPSGYFRQKARKLKAFVSYLDERHAGSLARMSQTPTAPLRSGLLGVWGIGPETADSILLYAFDRPVFVVDSYTKRVLVRHGWIDPNSTYADIQAFFEDRLDPATDLYNDFHAQFVMLGKDFCRTKPRCESCPLRDRWPPAT